MFRMLPVQKENTRTVIDNMSIMQKIENEVAKDYLLSKKITNGSNKRKMKVDESEKYLLNQKKRK